MEPREQLAHVRLLQHQPGEFGSHRGYRRRDSHHAHQIRTAGTRRVAGLFLLGVACTPMSEPGAPPPTYRSGTQSVAADAAATPQERAAALAFLQALAAEVSAVSIDLPCFPDVVVRISMALADPNT